MLMSPARRQKAALPFLTGVAVSVLFYTAVLRNFATPRIWDSNPPPSHFEVARSDRECEHESRPREKETHIVFLKTHKTGGSTIQNILMRYGDTYNLTFAVPKGKYQLGYPHKDSHSYVRKLNKTYNIMCHHARFDQKSIKQFMPNSSKYITILRHPVTLFPSAFHYYSWGSGCMGIANNSLSAMLSNEAHYRTRPICAGGIASRNVQLYDLGLDVHDMDNQEKVQEKIREIARVFDLVMINEYFDESLILLRDLFNWDTHDVLYVAHNVRSKQNREVLSAHEQTAILRRNKEDMMLYSAMLDILREKIRTYGEERMKREVEILRNMKMAWRNFCISGRARGKDMRGGEMAAQKPWDGNTFGFLLDADNANNTQCIKLTTAELRYSDYLYDKMTKFTPKKLSK